VHATPSLAAGPIGVFDSGLGGLSVLRALKLRLPAENFLYFADSGHAPYGERANEFVQARALSISESLVSQGAKILVVACNTATAAAIKALRQRWPQLPLVGVEPALKPAFQLSQTRHIAVLATRGTLQSLKFQALLAQQPPDLVLKTQACDGLADAIENFDTQKIEQLSAHYLKACGPLGQAPNEVDTVVLGCTHYPLILDTWQQQAQGVHFLDTGDAVARQTKRLLQEQGLLNPSRQNGLTTWLSSGEPDQLARAVAHWGI
jgi:glutamate racemase